VQSFPPLTLDSVQEYLRSYTAGEALPQEFLSEVLRQTRIFLDSEEVPVLVKARLQRLELEVLDSYRTQLPDEVRLLLSFVRAGGEGLSVGVLVKCVAAVLDLMAEVAKVSGLDFIPAYDLTALQSGGLSVEVRCLHLDYYQPDLTQAEPQYLSLVQRVAELFQNLATGDPLQKEALQQLLSLKARRSINQLVRLLRGDEDSDLEALTLTLAQGNQRWPCATLSEFNREYFYFPEAPEWEEIVVVGVLVRREQDLDPRRNGVSIQGQDGIFYVCRKFADRVFQDFLSGLPLGTKIQLTGKVKATDDPARKAECRVLNVEEPPLPEQQISLWE
jgi:hypothetical protein